MDNLPLTIPPVVYVKFSTGRAFGVEMEVNKKLSLEQLTAIVKKADPKTECMSSNQYQQDYGNDYWHVKFDRSCGEKINDGGWEVASYKASGAEDLVKISQMAASLREAGAEVNNNCGFHVHVEIADFNTSQAATIVANWMRIERMMQEILPKHRRNNVYCRLLTDRFRIGTEEHTPTTFWAMVRPHSFDNTERRVALNLCNFALSAPNRRTIELRTPEGTLIEKDVKNWTRLFIHFVNDCKKREFPRTLNPCVDLHEAVSVLGLHNEEPFYILSKGLYETKIWFLRRIVKYSSVKKLVQEAESFVNFIKPPENTNLPLTTSRKKHLKEVMPQRIVSW